MNIRKYLIALVCICLVFPLGAQDPSTQAPESWRERVKREGATLDLTLQDAIRLALVNNLTIAIEEFNEDLNRQRQFTTRGFYDPVLQFTVGWRSIESPSTSILTAGSGVTTFAQDSFIWNSRLLQNVPGGGSLQLDFNNDKVEDNNLFRTVNPQFSSDFNINFTQPLRRGFRQTQTERQLKLVNLDQEISDRQFEQRVAEIVQQVENQYWELLFAIENHETRRQSVELAMVQHDNNKKRVEIGVLAPIEITSARAEVSSREQEMIQAEVQIVIAQNRLKRSLSPDPGDSIWGLTLIPTDQPRFDQEVGISLDEAVQTALERRPELDQVRLQLEQNGVDQEYYRQEKKWAVNVRANYGTTGRAGDAFRTVPVFDDEGNPLGSMQELVSSGNLWDAVSQAWSYNFTNWGFFVDVEVPLFNRSREGQLAQSRVQEARLLSQLKDQQQAVMVEVRNAYDSVQIERKRLEAARLAHQLAREQLDGENKRFEAGLSTNFEVLRFQRDLTQAQAQVLRASLDYGIALTALRKATFTIVDDNDLTLAKQDQ